MRPAALAAALVAAAATVVASGAGAAGGNCPSELSTGGVCVELGVPPGAGDGAAPATSKPLLVWEETYGSREFVCWRLAGGPVEIALAEVADDLPPEAEVAVAYQLFPVDPSTGEPAGPARTVCGFAGHQPPAPPTADEVWRQVPLPRPAVRADPAGAALVGLEVRLWADPASAGPVAATVTIRGYTATVTATPVGYEWEPGDGTPALRSTTPGSQAAPAVTHAYARHGTPTIVHRVEYSGRYTLSGHGVTLSDRPLGVVRPEGSAGYRVIEVEAVIHD